MELPASSLAFTCCQVPVCFHLAADEEIRVNWTDGRSERIRGSVLPAGISSEIFSRTGKVAGLAVNILADRLTC